MTYGPSFNPVSLSKDANFLKCTILHTRPKFASLAFALSLSRHSHLAAVSFSSFSDAQRFAWLTLQKIRRLVFSSQGSFSMNVGISAATPIVTMRTQPNKEKMRKKGHFLFTQTFARSGNKNLFTFKKSSSVR